MGAGGAAAAIAAAGAMRAEKRIIEILRVAEATSAGKATPLHPKRLVQRGALRRLVSGGAVMDAGGEKYWLSETGYAAYQEDRRRRSMIALIVVLGLTAMFVAGTAVVVLAKGG